jgi:NAD(P)H-hydrate repair Nnr-like enzyme with NAD(P)H-hydrate dehydratase domain
MMLIVGTVPIKDMPLTLGTVKAEGDFLAVGGQCIPCTQGTGAMVSAALKTTDYLNLEAPQVLLVGDIGEGKGSRELYDYLIKNMAELAPEVLALHYWLPDMVQTRRLYKEIEKCARRPIMIADAASMYSAKAAGLATSFDIFTPDAAEMAFLADPDATHPAYIRFMVNTDGGNMPELIKTAYENKNAARLLLVKGAIDFIVKDGDVIDTITEPDVPTLEAIGGTGDTITGLVSSFVYAGLEPHEAAIIAARANRMAGKFAEATPATKVGQVIAQFPEVFRKYLCEWSGVCATGGVKYDGSRCTGLFLPHSGGEDKESDG